MTQKSLVTKLTPLLCMGLFATPNSALSLGLGEIKHSSAFGQELRAKLHFVTKEDLEFDELKLSQVSPEEAKKLGVELVYSHGNLKFELVKKDGVISHAKVKSTRPILEPYINLFIKLETPTGSLYREYTILMDMPVARNAKANSSNTNKPRKLIAQSEKRPISQVNSSIALGDSYKVKAGDSLSKIISRTGVKHVEKSQLMANILAANPHAFINGNINLLKLGATISIPQHIQTSVSEKPESLNANTSDQALNNQKLASSDKVQKSGRLKLTTVKDSQSANYAESLKSKIDIAHEKLDKVNKENKELRERIARIENSEYWETAARMLTLQTQRIERLQELMLAQSLPEKPAVDQPALSGFFIPQANAEVNTNSIYSATNQLQKNQRHVSSTFVSVIAAFIMLAAFALMYRGFDCLNRGIRRTFNLIWPGSKRTSSDMEIDMAYRYGGAKFEPGNVFDCEVKQRVIQKTQQYRVDSGQSSDMEISELNNIDDAIEELLKISDEHVVNGRFSEARAILQAQKQVMPDARLDYALIKVKLAEDVF